MNRRSRKLPVLFEMDKSPGFNLLILKIFYTTISCGQGPNSIPSLNPLSLYKRDREKILKTSKKGPVTITISIESGL